MVNTRSIRTKNQAQPLGQGQLSKNLPPHLPPQIPNMFPLVEHAKRRDENQPHNSAHNSTSIPNQGDIVTAQLVAMQQQFGVFQLVLAQLLTRNNLGDPLINLLNPTQQPLVQQQDPQPVQHASALIEQRNATPPHHNTNSIPHPLNTNITLEPYPAGFKIPQLKPYDGTKDPDDHLHAFYSCMQAQNASDALMCKIFPSTLRDNAQTWYYSLPPRSFSSYTEMSSSFAIKFSNRRLIRKTTSELMRVKQREGESLKNYMSRFNDAIIKVSSFNQSVGIAAIIQGLQHNRFRDSLIKHPTATFNEVNDRSLKFITVEEYALSQKPVLPKNQNPNWRNEAQSRKRMKTVQSRVVTPHNDPLVTSVMINNCEVQRILVDTGSALHIMYFHYFESLELDPALLQSGRTYVTPLVRFLVIKMASSFNVVIERPTLMEIRAVISQSHLCMKFPTPMGIATLREVIKEEVEKLLQAGFIRRVDYCEWVANPMLVKKANGKWQMGIDYTISTKLVPKTHQVLMASKDKEKISFYASDEIYYYVMMPFGLKNASATYQKMVTIVFQAQISKNLEVYVNDIVEVHEGVCGSHIGARTLAHKVLRQGYYWPNMYEDATHFVQRCPKCQFFAHLTHQPTKELTNLVAPYPFAQWGLDLLGVPSFRVTHFDEGQNGQLLRENLDLLAEVKEEARLRTLVYKQKLANFCNKRVRPRTFKVGVLVLRKAGLTGFETRFGKLALNWEGRYIVADMPHPGAYILHDVEGKRVLRVWNINNLKKFYP
ncbi:hypothetical protein SLEP1_g43719 [Rubroshorea leprosula]|uniref:Uncharacterized protein n=1 Tax=Rubroshorea leprosula TaxID=152421 RepID=A0AAV5LEY6_9ROSI|nr:hypothetical protein SLEP1_g43719 [Rubroshorea leprosula]